MDTMTKIGDAIVAMSNWLWGPPLLILLGCGGLFLTIRESEKESGAHSKEASHSHAVGKRRSSGEFRAGCAPGGKTV